jgi:hypothetical protein
MKPKFYFKKILGALLMEDEAKRQERDYIAGLPDGDHYRDYHKVGKPKSPEQLGYYYATILPEAIEAFLNNEDFSLTVNMGDKVIELELTLLNMDDFLKLRYAAMTGKYVAKGEMNMAECSAYEDWCIKWLSTWLNCNVPKADKDWRSKL